MGQKPTEVLIIETVGSSYRCLLRGRNIKEGAVITFHAPGRPDKEAPFTAVVTGTEDVPGMRTYLLAFTSEGSFENALAEYASLPLPPYITESTAPDERYQTIFANQVGSAAAPTAWLHFTPELITSLKEHGATWNEVTLHVGLGTFLPLRNESVRDNALHNETTYISPETADALNSRGDAPLLAIGTTSVRTLESHFADGSLRPGWDNTSLFTYPGYRFNAVDALMTNFHLPKSSLLMLVAAFLGNPPEKGKSLTSEPEMIAELQRIYSIAIQERYRFFSFGDAMLII